MDKVQYLAATANGNNSSGFKDTEAEAIAWAKTYMAKTTVTQIYIYRTVSIVRRAEPPVEVIPLPQYDIQQASDAEKQNGMRHPVHGAHERLGSDDFANMA